MKTIQLARPKETSQAISRAPQQNTQKPLHTSPHNDAYTNPHPKPHTSTHTGHKSQQSPASNTKICCCYINNTAQFQIIRVAHLERDHESSGIIERTVPPHTRILFEANSCDRLEIHTGHLMTAIHSDSIPCDQLAYPAPFTSHD